MLNLKLMSEECVMRTWYGPNSLQIWSNSEVVLNLWSLRVY